MANTEVNLADLLPLIDRYDLLIAVECSAAVERDTAYERDQAVDKYQVWTSTANRRYGKIHVPRKSLGETRQLLRELAREARQRKPDGLVDSVLKKVANLIDTAIIPELAKSHSD
jgi:hypothetical protein